MKYDNKAEEIISSSYPHKKLIDLFGIIVFVLVIITVVVGVHLEESHKPLINQLSDVELDLSLLNLHSNSVALNTYNSALQDEAPTISNIVKTLNSLIKSNNWDDVIFPLILKKQEKKIINLTKDINSFKSFYKKESDKKLTSHKTFFLIDLIDRTIEIQNDLDDRLNNQTEFLHGTQFVTLGILFIYFVVAYTLIKRYEKTKINLFIKQQNYLKLVKETNFFMQKSQKVAQMGYFLYDFDKKEWNLSEEFAEILGLTNNVISYDEGLNMILLEDRKILIDIFKKRCQNNNFAFDIKYRIKRPKDNSIRWINHIANDIELDSNKNPLPVFGILQDITEKRKLERDYINAFIEAQEQEKQNFGEELHDGISQILSAESMYIQILLGENKDRLKDKTKYLLKIKELNERAINDGRRIAHGLMSKQLKQNGLIKAVASICTDYNNSKDIVFSFKLKDIVESEIAKPIKTNIFRVCQEVTTNIVRHSGATKATISFAKTADNALKLVIEDNGVGIDFEKMKHENRGAGLKNIERRVTLLNGKLNLQSKLKQGTKYTIIIPLKSITYIKRISMV